MGDPKPLAKTAAVGKFIGIIDEARIWNTERSLSECMYTELGTSGNCSYSNNMVMYLSFNECAGSQIADLTNVFGFGAKEYPDMANPDIFLPWNSGWTTEPPGLTTDD